jgi:WD40 repeat protein
VDRTARVWDVATGGSRVLRGHDEAVRAIGFSPDGRTVATGSNDQAVQLWNLETGALTVLRGHRAAVRSVAFHPGGKQLVTASEDATLRVWDLERAAPVPHDRAELIAWLHAQTTAALRTDPSAIARRPAEQAP